MAYLPKLLPEDQENKFARTEPTTPVPQGGGSGGTSGGTSPNVGDSAAFGGNAAKVSDYIKANKEQIQRVGGNIASDLTNRYQNTVNQINQGVGQFGSDVQGSYTPYDPTRVQEAKQNPGEFLKNDQNVQDFQSWLRPSYGGPSSFEGTDIYSNLNKDVNKAVEKASLVNTLPGMNTYFQEYAGTTNLSPGMKSLDALLLQRTPEAREKIQEAAKPYSTLNDYLGTKAGEANQFIPQAIQSAQDQADQLQQEFTGEGGAVSGLKSDIENRVQDLRSQATARDQELRNILGNIGFNTIIDPTYPQTYTQVNRDKTTEQVPYGNVYKDPTGSRQLYYGSFLPGLGAYLDQSGQMFGVGNQAITPEQLSLLSSEIPDQYQLYPGGPSRFDSGTFNFSNTQDSLMRLMLPLEYARRGAQYTGPADQRNQYPLGVQAKDLSLLDYLSTQDPNQTITFENATRPEDYQKAADYERLLGQELGVFDPNMEAQAGTASTDISNFDFQRALMELGKQGVLPYDLLTQAPIDERETVKPYEKAVPLGGTPPPPILEPPISEPPPTVEPPITEPTDPTTTYPWILPEEPPEDGRPRLF